MHDSKGEMSSRDGRDSPVVVVGTTPDYVERICSEYQGSVLFTLDEKFRGDPLLKRVDPSILFFAPLEEWERVFGSMEEYLTAKRLSPKGIACFDCENLVLASLLAARLGLFFPPVEAVLNTRNKLETRRKLVEAGLCGVRAIPASGLEETLGFFRDLGKEIVIKPLTGSGSELLFRCGSEREVRDSVRILAQELPMRRSNHLFHIAPKGAFPALSPDPCRTWIAEEYVSGPEYSCDFVLNGGQVTIIRETGKLMAPDQTFGSVLAYTCPPSYPEGFSIDGLSVVLRDVSRALGFSMGYFMVDFVVHEGQPFIIEISPRPGGDSIPHLVKTAMGCDTIGLYLDMACGRPFYPDRDFPIRPSGSLNLYGTREGIITLLDTSEMEKQGWVRKIFLKKRAGDRIGLPPHDYDNRLLGYCIVSLEQPGDLIHMHQALLDLMKISITN